MRFCIFEYTKGEMIHSAAPDIWRVAACDLGQATACMVIARVDAGGALAVEHSDVVYHEGDPLGAFSRWYSLREVHSCRALGATGAHARELRGSLHEAVPEDACQEAALGMLGHPDGAINLLRVGASGYSVLTRDHRGRVEHQQSDKCSSGTGETMVKIAGRFGLTLEQADELAASADKAIPITARCSVFAKSEMTHFGNQGKPAAGLFAGYFSSVARYAVALLERARAAAGTAQAPVLLVGGGALVGALVRSISERAGEVVVPRRAQLAEALGAAALAAEGAGRACPLPPEPEALIRRRRHSFTSLPPPSRFAEHVTRLEAPPTPAGAAREPSVLGLDLGSTGSKAVLTSVRTGQPVLALYDRTRGNPVDATRRLLRALHERTGGEADVRAVGLTGSGREAAATLFFAALPGDRDPRVVVLNEIVAHATAAVRCDPDGGRDLSVVEIGGQDAKYILVRGGQIVESDMNKACSAGTGSFLEEQAVFYGVDSIEQFAQQARQATSPPDLGQMCTVFVAAAATEARDQGHEIPDIFAGFQYSVIHNYINRVMGQRTFGERIFFQGKPAQNEGLARSLAAVTGRQVTVPADPGSMGAWGIGLCVLDRLPETLDAGPLDLGAVQRAEVVERTEFQCHDRDCGTLCVIERTTVELAGQRHKVLSGGACPRYEVPSAGRRKLPEGAPSAFHRREELVQRFAAERHGAQVVGVPLVGAVQHVLPWVVTLLAELGLGVRVLRTDRRSLARGEERCHCYDACSPVKAAHGLCRAGVDALFLPKVLSLRTHHDPEGATCPMEQALPEMLENALAARGDRTPVLRPVLDLADGLGPGVAKQLAATARRLGVRPRSLRGALRRAEVAQRAHERALMHIGQQTLDYGRRHGLPVVVVCGSLHVIHDPAISAGVPSAVRQCGVLALPQDCYPMDDDAPTLVRAPWAETNRALRVALDARRRGGVYPLLLTSFGCGPASFLEQVFCKLMEGYPHTVLETDGHGGSAGYVTRVEAFLHTVHGATALTPDPPARTLEVMRPLRMPRIRREQDSRIVVFSMGDRFGHLAAAYYRSLGFEAEALEPNSPETLAAGRADCTGKECLPYQLIWGSFRRHLEQHPPRRRTVLLQVSGTGSCRNCMFSVKDQLTLDRLGLADRVVSRHLGPEPGYEVDFITRFYSSLVTWDILIQLKAYLRPLARRPADVDRCYERLGDSLVALLARPRAPGPLSLFSGSMFWRELTALVSEAADAFADLVPGGARPNGRPAVLLSGDVFLRLDDMDNDALVRRLQDAGLQVLVEPLGVLVEYMALERSSEILGLPTDMVRWPIMRRALPAIRRKLYDLVLPRHPWMPMPDVAAMQRLARPVLDRYPIGEAPAALGSVLHTHQQGHCQGAVLVSPWGCGPALIAESLLRHRRDIPSLFIYSDGSPVDQGRIDSFAFRLRQGGASAGASPPGQNTNG